MTCKWLECRETQRGVYVSFQSSEWEKQAAETRQPQNTTKETEWLWCLASADLSRVEANWGKKNEEEQIYEGRVTAHEWGSQTDREGRQERRVKNRLTATVSCTSSTITGEKNIKQGEGTLTYKKNHPCACQITPPPPPPPSSPPTPPPHQPPPPQKKNTPLCPPTQPRFTHWNLSKQITLPRSRFQPLEEELHLYI